MSLLAAYSSDLHKRQAGAAAAAVKVTWGANMSKAGALGPPLWAWGAAGCAAPPVGVPDGACSDTGSAPGIKSLCFSNLELAKTARSLCAACSRKQ